MPPAISDDEASDVGEVTVPLLSTRGKKARASLEDGDGEMRGIVKGEVAKDEVANGDGDDGQGEDDENLDEDEYIVEKILAHVVEPDGALKFKVKWEGWEKKSDQTWENYESLSENASDIVEEYLSRFGGLEKILDEGKSALKTKKRGRPASGTPTNGTKRRRNESHPASETPPASNRAWKPPVGSWEDEVESIDACHDEVRGKLVVYLTWKNGNKTQHDTKVVYKRCPQKMLQFYEQHVKIVMASSDGAIKEE
ncbi:heterochromatin protein one [Daldinia loculata]|uniref:heterochromatin protein one n=1 Tax=Daldinia loculata TaxID=103429 RepID=UPI0020C2B0F9|nr:heterochromatin protein one [Daldinia loculata]KAI1649025.1 heterochromatin protein one [Daldinia loculata]KAI2780383.1 heterochromatin protein one [Daldinia loculata]